MATFTVNSGQEETFQVLKTWKVGELSPPAESEYEL